MEFNVADLIERVVSHIPEKEAVVCGDKRLTYSELNEKGNSFGAYLLNMGMKKGDKLAIYSYNCMEWAEVLLGCYKAGIIPININYRYAEEELFYIFDDADINGVVYQCQFAPKLKNIVDRLPLLKHFVHMDDASGEQPLENSKSFYEAINFDSSSTDWPMRSGEDHWVLYTGGTTGMPKGVIWTQHNVIMALGGGIDMATQEAFPNPEAMADRCSFENAFYMRSLQMAPLMHGAAQWGLLRGLFDGFTVVLSDSLSFDADEVWQLVEKEKINTLLVTGDAMAKPMMDALLKAKKSGKPYDVSSMLVFASSAAVFSPYLKDMYSDELPNVMIMDNIGSTESGYTGATIHEKGKAEANSGGPRVNPGKDVVVLDEDYNLLEPGSDKKGYIAKGGFIPLAYHKDDKKTAETFITAKDGNRYVIPGDMATFNADGTITMLGRGSLCINSGGEKIFPEEVEVAAKAHEAIFDCLVVATPDERFGQCVTALIQLVEGYECPQLEALHEICERHIARYKLPRRLYVVDEIKRAPSGKPDYKWAKEEAMRQFESQNNH